MKILFLDTYPIRRGAQVFITELAEYLENKGEETNRYYFYKSEKNAVEVSLRTQDKCFGFDPNHIFEKIPTFQPSLVNTLIREIKHLKPDVVLLNGSRTLKYGAILKLFLPKSIKWVSRVIDNAEFWNTGKLTHAYYKKLVIPAMDASIGVSQASLQGMIRHYTFKKPTRVIHRVFDPKKFEQAPSRALARKSLGIPAGEEVLLFLGNLSKQKRPDRFIAIIHELRKHRPAVCGILVGDGPLRKSCEQQVKSLDKLADSAGSPKTGQTPLNQWSSKITFFGYQEDVSAYLAAADVLVLTSDTEGLPGVVLEAAHFEVPTVASAVGGIRECLLDGETGLIVAEPSISNFTQALEKLLADPTLKNQLGKNAKRFVSTHFRMELVAQQYLDFFKEIVP